MTLSPHETLPTSASGESSHKSNQQLWRRRYSYESEMFLFFVNEITSTQNSVEFEGPPQHRTECICRNFFNIKD